jgi:transporter family protein
MLDTSVTLALCSLVIYGLTQVLAKAAVRSVNAASMVSVNFLVSIPIYAVFLIATLFLVDPNILKPEYILYSVIGATTARGGYYVYLTALEKGSVTMVGSITAAYPAITATMAVLVLDEELRFSNGLGIVVIIASMVALSYVHGRHAGKGGFSRMALILSLTTFFVWGFGGVFIKLALMNIPLIAYLSVYPFVLPPLAIAYLKYKKATREVIFPKWSVPIMAAAAVAILWQLAYFAETGAVSQGAASIVFPIISAYPIVTIIGARAFLGEKLSKIDLILLGAVMVGILLTSVA